MKPPAVGLNRRGLGSRIDLTALSNHIDPETGLEQLLTENRLLL